MRGAACGAGAGKGDQIITLPSRGPAADCQAVLPNMDKGIPKGIESIFFFGVGEEQGGGLREFYRGHDTLVGVRGGTEEPWKCLVPSGSREWSAQDVCV